ncbi:FAD/NAD(P)-binding oxidoreductase [Striga asiatica]|uniref:FAD/NAD(P)-binding oxidoreductase n=1 Tax=Striga asiatica TaxID=4170 RepID=A0A5A7QNR7_STRAF|nr:FAD/NAD(P)-binding oxidoreductase [Striga asiatica]
MAFFLRRLANAASIYSGGQKNSGSRLRFGALAAISGAISSYYFISSPSLVYLDQLSEDSTEKIDWTYTDENLGHESRRKMHEASELVLNESTVLQMAVKESLGKDLAEEAKNSLKESVKENLKEAIVFTGVHYVCVLEKKEQAQVYDSHQKGRQLGQLVVAKDKGLKLQQEGDRKLGEILSELKGLKGLLVGGKGDGSGEWNGKGSGEGNGNGSGEGNGKGSGKA